MSWRYLLVLLSLFAVLAPRTAVAACSIPTGAAGDIIYNGTYNVLQYCNGTAWINAGQVGVNGGTMTSGDFCTTNGSLINCQTPFTGTGNVVLSASPTLTGTVTAAAALFSGNVGIGTNSASTALQVIGTASATTFAGSGAGLTNVPFSSLGAATSTNTIDNAANAQTWTWNSLGSSAGLTMSTSAAATGSLLSLSASSTSYAGNLVSVTVPNGAAAAGLYISAGGGSSIAIRANNANAGYGVYSSSVGGLGVLGTDNSASGIGISASNTAASGAGKAFQTSATSATGYAIYSSSGLNYLSGNAAIGTTSFTNALNVGGTASATTFAGSGASLTNIGVSNMTSVTGTPGATNFLRGDGTWSALTTGTMPSLPSADIWVGSAGNIATPQAVSGDCALANTGAITCTKTNNVAFGGLATVSSANLTTQVTGTLPILNGGTNATSQTTNGVIYFNGTNITSGTGLTFTGTAFGIGTTTPATAVEVYRTTGTYWTAGGHNWGGSVTPPQALTVTNAYPSGYDPVLLFRQATGAGTLTTTGGIGFVGTNSWADGTLAYQTSDMYFVSRDNAGVLQERMRITSGGNVGIGVTGPSTPLQVNGTVTATTFAGSGSSLTSIPASALSATGTANSTTFLRGDNTWGTIAGGGGATGTGTAGYVARWTGTSSLGVGALTDNGTNVGIGTSVGMWGLDVRGIISAGNASSANGSIMMQSYYDPATMSATAVFGTDRSSGALELNYGVDPSLTTTDAFTSSSVYNMPRASIIVGDGIGSNAGMINFYAASAQTVAIGSAVSMSPVMVITGGGSVGIGTNAPASTLSVAGKEDITNWLGIGSNAQLDSSGEIFTMYNAGSGHALMRNSDDSSGTLYVSNISHTANTNQPYVVLSDGSGNRGGLGVRYTDSSLWVTGQGGIRFLTGTACCSGSERARIDSSGNLGIGSTSPAYKLDVVGTGNFSTGVNVPSAQAYMIGGANVVYGTGTHDYIYSGSTDFVVTKNDGSANLVTVTNGGNVGIGNASPGTKLTVQSSYGSNQALFTYDGTNGIFMQAQGTTTHYNWLIAQQDHVNGGLEFTPSTAVGGTTFSTPALYINASGNVNIAGTAFATTFSGSGASLTSIPASALSATGTANSTTFLRGDNTWTSLASSGVTTGTGTTNYVPMWTSSSALGNSAIYQSSSNIGIGTTGPTSPLQVAGTGQTTAALTDSGVVGATLNLSDTNAANPAGAGGAILFTSAATSGIYAQAAIKELLTNGGGRGIGDLAFSTRNTTADTALTERMRISAAGNVGIGTTGPLGKLSVVNAGAATDVDIGANVTGHTLLQIQTSADTSGYSLLQSIQTQGSTYGTLVLNPNGGNVGIGLTSPNTSLTLAGNGSGLSFNAPNNIIGSNVYYSSGWKYASNGYGSVIKLDNDGSLEYFQAASNGSGAGAAASLTQPFTINASGNVGIGNTSPAYSLDILKNGGTSGTTLLNMSSNDTWQTAYTLANTSTGGHTYTIISTGSGNSPVGALQFYDNTSTATRLLINSSGNVGIGTTVPGGPLHVYTSNGTTAERLEYSGSAQYSGANLELKDNVSTSNQQNVHISQSVNDGANTYSAFSIGQFNSADSYVQTLAQYDENGNSWNFFTAGTSRLFINSSGNVGIGQTGPQFALTNSALSNVTSTAFGGLGGSAHSFVWEHPSSDSTGGYAGAIANSYAGGGYNGLLIKTTDTTSSTNILEANSNGSTRMLVRADGNVGIGNTSPAWPLDVTGTIRSNWDNGTDAGNIHLRSPSNGKTWMITQRAATSYNLEFWNFNGTSWLDAVDVTPSGNVGIGNAGPGQKLTINSGTGGATASTTPVAFLASAGTVGGTIGNDINIGGFSANSGNASYLNAHLRQISSTVNWTGTAIGLSYDVDSTVGAGGSIWFSNGNIGIGTTSPIGAFNVQGNAGGLNANWSLAQLDITGTNPNQRLEIGYDTTNDQGVIQAGKNGTGWEPLLLNPVGGNVGIGKTNPATALDVNGTITATAFSGPGMISGGTANYVPLWSGANTLTTSAMYQSGGSTLVGMTSPLTVPGNSTFEVYGGASTSSGIWSIAASGGQGSVGAYDLTTGHVGAYLYSNSGSAGIATMNNAGAYTGSPINFTATSVGIQQISPSYVLDINAGANGPGMRLLSSSQDDVIRYENTGTGGRVYHVGSTGSSSGAGNGFSVYDVTGSAPRLLINPSGNVGIGVTNPAVNLQIGGTTSTSTATPAAISIGGTFSSTAGANAKLRVWTDGTNVMGFGVSSNQLDYITSGPYDHVFYANGSERMRITSAGRVGIGTSVPYEPLDLASTDQYANMRVIHNVHSSADSNMYFGYNDPAGGNLFFYGQGTTAQMTVQGSTGNVGIGNASPLAALSVGAGSLSDTNVSIQTSTGAGGTLKYIGVNKNGGYGLLMGYDNGTSWQGAVIRQITTDPLYFVVNNSTTAMTILSSGNVGIGNTSPTNKLEVAGAITATGSNGSNDNGLHMSFASNIGYLQSLQNGVAWRELDLQGTPVVLNPAALGNVGIGIEPSFPLEISAGANRDINFRNDPTSFGYPSGLTGIILQGINDAQNAEEPITIEASKLNLEPSGGYVGIGNTSPNTTLHVDGANNNTYGQMEVQSTGSDARISLYNSAGATTTGRGDINMSSSTGYQGMRFMINGTDQMIVASNGDVGIGNTSPSYTLDVSGTGRFTSNLTVGGTFTPSGLLYASGGLEFPENSWMYAPGGVNRNLYIGPADMYFELGGAGSFHFRNSSDVDQAYISSTGTMTLGGNLNFSAANPLITSGGSWVGFPYGIYSYGGPSYFQTVIEARSNIANDSAAYLTISGGTSGYTYFNGSVGIGNTSPQTLLDVKGALGNPPTTGTTRTGTLLFENVTDTGMASMGIKVGGAGFWIQSHDSTQSIDYPLLLNPSGGNIGINGAASNQIFVTGSQGYLNMGANGWTDPQGSAEASIITDNNSYKALMIVGNSVAGNSGKGREVKLWDYLNVQGGSNATGDITWGGTGTLTNDGTNAYVQSKSGGALIFRTNGGTEFMRIASGGTMSVNTTSGPAQFNVNGSVATLANSGATGYLAYGRASDNAVWAPLAINNAQNAYQGGLWWSSTGLGIDVGPSLTQYVSILNSGYVGIGAGFTAPSQQLDVLNELRVSGTGATNVYGVVSLGNHDNGAYIGDNGIYRGGIGTVGGNNYLNLAGYAGIAFDTSAAAFGSQTTRMYIDGSSGAVGIGNTSPNGRFEVASNVAGNGVLDGIVMYQPADNQQSIQTYIDGQWGARTTYGGPCCNQLNIETETGNVVIGNTLANSGVLFPGATTTNGTANFNGTVNISTTMNFSTYGGGWYMADGTWIRSAGGKPMYESAGLDTGAASGIGCGGALGGGYMFQVCGSAKVTSTFLVTADTYSNNYYHNSDRRLKDNIKPIGGLDVVDKLNGVSFTWKKDGKLSAGVIAQDVEAVMPEAVATDDKGMKSVSYDELIAPMIEAIKELKADNDNLRADTEKQLKADNDNLRAEIAELHHEMADLRKQINAH